MAWSFSSWFRTTEADIVALITKLKDDVVIAEHDVAAALKWVGAQTPTIVAGLQTALSLAQAVGVVSAPELLAANAAVSALNAFAKAQNAGKGDAQAVVNGYVAYQQANAAVAAAKATAAAAAPKKGA